MPNRVPGGAPAASLPPEALVTYRQRSARSHGGSVLTRCSEPEGLEVVFDLPIAPYDSGV